MSEKRKRLVIIDGKSVFYRGYYAMPGLATSEGTPTGGVYGFAVMALEVIKRLNPDYVCVAWDKPKTNIAKRLALYPQYKANRKPAPPDFYEQIPLLHNLLQAFGWPLYELDDYEADDIMAGLAKKAEESGVETVLISSDQDLLQLINDYVSVYSLKKGLSNIEELKPESFRQKYGIDVHQFVDLKALKGDSSDNIPGVAGIGEKTALSLLQQFGTIENIYENLYLVPTKVAQKLEKDREIAFLSKTLVTLMTDAPIEFDKKAMTIENLKHDELIKALKNLEFRSLIAQIPERMNGSSEHSQPKINHRAKVHDYSTADLQKIQKSDTIITYTRARGSHGRQAELVYFSIDGNTVYQAVIDELKPQQKTKLVELLSGKRIVALDSKYDYKVLLSLGVKDIKIEYDLLVGHFLINSLVKANNLTELAVHYLDEDVTNPAGLPSDELSSYVPQIFPLIIKIREAQQQKLQTLPKIVELMKNLEWPFIPVIASMELIGLPVNKEYLNKMSDDLSDTVSDLTQEIYGLADNEFNIGSPKQLAEILFEKLNLPTIGIKKGKSGLSTAADELAKLRELHPIIDLISQYREVTKLKNTYADALPKLVDEDNRIRSTFSLTTASTGRLSSLDPNLQNIPVRTELGKKIRGAFVTQPGRVFINADYSQFELRIAASLSNDEHMIDAFNSDSDIHIETASLVYGIAKDDVTKEQRYNAKAVNFGIMYGQGPHGLAQATGMDFATAREFIDKFFKVRAPLKDYISNTRTKASEQGYVETVMGRRRPCPDVKSSNFAVREAAYRAAVNMPIQGSAADLTKLAMIRISDYFSTKDWQQVPNIVLQIHDSIMVECAESDAVEISQNMKKIMENVYPDLHIKLQVDIATSNNWGKL